MMKLVLEHSGYQVQTASDGVEGLAKFGDGHPWDLVLLDQRMPGMPGIEVQREIYRRNRETRLILITAFGTIDLALEAIKAGASEFLRKPFTADTLRSAVASALSRPVCHDKSAPVHMVCREFTRTTINGFSFDLAGASTDDRTGEIVCRFNVQHTLEAAGEVTVVLPVYVQELVKAYTDSEYVPGGDRFWHAMCEEALANFLWQNAQMPPGNSLRIEDLSTGLQKWLDSMLTVSLAD